MKQMLFIAAHLIAAVLSVVFIFARDRYLTDYYIRSKFNHRRNHKRNVRLKRMLHSVGRVVMLLYLCVGMFISL